MTESIAQQDIFVITPIRSIMLVILDARQALKEEVESISRRLAFDRPALCTDGLFSCKWGPDRGDTLQVLTLYDASRAEAVAGLTVGFYSAILQCSTRVCRRLCHPKGRSPPPRRPQVAGAPTRR